VIDEIEAQRLQLSPSERRVADYVLRQGEAVLRKSLATIADEAGVSEPTVLRFCRALGSTGLPDFKLRLAARLSSGPPLRQEPVRSGDTLENAVNKICGASSGALDSLRKNIDLGALDRATTALLGARRIDCYGIGGSSIAAVDLYQKFMHLGMPVQYSADTHLQTVLAATLHLGDVAVVFSQTGQSRDTVRAARTAAQSGATVIGITAWGTALSAECAITIAVDPVEEAFLYAPVVGEIAHVVVADILATAVALRRGPQIGEQYTHIKESLRDLWIGMDVAREPAEEPAMKPLPGRGGASPARLRDRHQREE
jgi:RpiR family carbohydrate utilization transcriptional regulator